MVNERVNGCFGELNGITVLIKQFNLGFELVGIAEFVKNQVQSGFEAGGN